MKKTIICGKFRVIPKCYPQPGSGNLYKYLCQGKKQLPQKASKKLKPGKIGVLKVITEDCYKNLPWNSANEIVFEALQRDASFKGSCRAEKTKLKPLAIKYNQRTVENNYKSLKSIRVDLRKTLKGTNCERELDSLGFRILSDLGSYEWILNDSAFLKFAEHRYRLKDELMENLLIQQRQCAEVKRRREEKIFLKRVMEKPVEQRSTKFTFPKTPIKVLGKKSISESVSSSFDKRKGFGMLTKGLINKKYGEFLNDNECDDATSLRDLFADAKDFINDKLFHDKDSDLSPNDSDKNESIKSDIGSTASSTTTFMEKMQIIRHKSQMFIDFLVQKSKVSPT